VAKYTLLILADDLTGALDSGVQFARKGIPTRVILEPFAGDEPAAEQVLVINTGTRHCPAREAAETLAACVKHYGPAEYFYKKTDSTLRGNPGAEIAALMEALDIERLPFIPAYPALGRTTTGGRQYLNGQPIDKTSMARDPLNPIRSGFIPDILHQGTGLPAVPVPRRSPIPAPASNREILVFDAETDGDLAAIAASLMKRRMLGASAGCAGFAGALMEVLPFAQTRALSGERPKLEKLPVLVLSGSRHPVSLGQVKTALDGGIPGFFVEGKNLLEDQWFASARAEALAEDCGGALAGQGICLLGTALALGGEENGPALSAAETENLSGRLGPLALKILSRTGPLHLVVFGGDTLLGIMRALEFPSILPLEEILPGIVLARAEGRGRGAFIVTKSGAFGEKDAIESIRNYLGEAAETAGA
jgi:uncharacterized protein YgbK (DUF1537 family)